MKIIYTILIICSLFLIALSQTVFDPPVLNPPKVEIELCSHYIVRDYDIPSAVTLLENKGCKVIIDQSELVPEYWIVHGVKLEEVGLQY